ncbi:hypothetical protein AMC83_PA00029 (plasmid) [Rhizobium phaseoli]|uniref:hypothetical protein n=1 Tax=Rhizobium phaseoli TaxID=396 RepID=UPI0007EA4D91|nr:hypothetical protein [Rhizobium phaseoli]ANL74256.1 hypothetical protein AMC83_PA00029 [Rhizobium phaseoli]
MWLFGKTKVQEAPPTELKRHAVSQPPIVALSHTEIKRQAVREAISALGLIKPSAEDTMVGFLGDEMEIDPRQTLTAYRKGGEQLSKDEKRALGLRSNAFLSRRAHEDLTEAGREVPLKAHETVLLRATFTLNRYRTLQSIKASDIVADKAFKGISYDVLNASCPVCGPLSGKTIQIEDASIFPLKGCTCATANFGYRADIDFLTAWND